MKEEIKNILLKHLNDETLLTNLILIDYIKDSDSHREEKERLSFVYETTDLKEGFD